MRVLMLVQQMDERDWLRAFIIGWVRALAAQVDAVDVLTLERGQVPPLPANVAIYSMGKEHGKNRARELFNFNRHMLRLAPRADVIFSHMTPRFTVLAAPYALGFGRRQVLWYAHRQVTREVRLALACSWRIATSLPQSFPIASPKVRALGQGIDSVFYHPANQPAADSTPTIVHVARLMPIKHQATLIRALPALPNVRAVFIGDVPTGQEQYVGYAAELRALAAQLGVADRVTFTGGLLPPAVREWYWRAAVAVNLSPAGLFDKTGLESMAAGVPTLVASHAFDALLVGEDALLRLDAPDDIDGLAQRLRALLALTPAERAAIGRAQRDQVAALHSLDRLMARMACLFATGEIDGSG